MKEQIAQLEGWLIEKRDFIQKLNDQKEELRQRLLVEVAEHDVVAEQVKALRKIETMSDGERVALLQAIQATGIESAAEVGIPGSVPKWKKLLGR